MKRNFDEEIPFTYHVLVDEGFSFEWPGNPPPSLGETVGIPGQEDGIAVGTVIAVGRAETVNRLIVVHWGYRLVDFSGHSATP